MTSQTSCPNLRSQNFEYFQSQDIESLVRTARRRAADEKATVRKAGVALLEALLLLRAGPPPPLQRLPSGADMAALQAAARDPLVSQHLQEKFYVLSSSKGTLEICTSAGR